MRGPWNLDRSSEVIIMHSPFAVEIYERFLSGESIRQLSINLRIPADRIEKRIRAAAIYLEGRPHLSLIAASSSREEPCGEAQ